MTADPVTTHAVIVGVEEYAAGPDWNLDGAAADALRFAAWVQGRGVPAQNVTLLLSPLARNTARIQEGRTLTGRDPRPATENEVVRVLDEELPALQASLLLFFWGGHGWITSAGDRRLLCADATDANRKNIDLNARLTALRSDRYPGLLRQAFLIDACANYVVNRGNTPPGDSPALGTPLPACEQFVLCGAKPGDYAKHLGDQQTGLFSRELLAELNALPAGSPWPPDLEALTSRLKSRFADLRSRKETKQTPSFLWSRGWDGSDMMFSEITAAAPVAPTPPRPKPVLPRKLSISELTRLRDAFVACQSLLSRADREQLVLQLRTEISTRVTLSGAAVADVLSLIRTAREYPGGLAEVLDGVELYEQGSLASQSLRAEVAALLPEEMPA